MRGFGNLNTDGSGVVAPDESQGHKEPAFPYKAVGEPGTALVPAAGTPRPPEPVVRISIKLPARAGD